MTIADEIRAVTSQNRLHPLVRDNWASPRGLCNCHTLVFDVAHEPAAVFCKRDFGHEGEHVNEPHKWESPWPPPQLDTRVRTVIEAIANRQTDTLEATEGTSDVS